MDFSHKVIKTSTGCSWERFREHKKKNRELCLRGCRRKERNVRLHQETVSVIKLWQRSKERRKAGRSKKKKKNGHDYDRVLCVPRCDTMKEKVNGRRQTQNAEKPMIDFVTVSVITGHHPEKLNQKWRRRNHPNATDGSVRSAIKVLVIKCRQLQIRLRNKWEC